MGFGRDPLLLGKGAGPPFPSLSPQDPGCLCCASISLLELLLRTQQQVAAARGGLRAERGRRLISPPRAGGLSSLLAPLKAA